MNAAVSELLRAAQALTADVTRPIAGSRKLYVRGSRDDLRVPMREIALADTPSSFGAEANAPFTLYDTSGPYTDPEYSVDLAAGLPALRANSTTCAFRVCRNRGVRRPSRILPRCTMRGAALSRRKWNSSRSGRTRSLKRCGIRRC